jgi:hypothetical protein
MWLFWLICQWAALASATTLLFGSHTRYDPVVEALPVCPGNGDVTHMVTRATTAVGTTLTKVTSGCSLGTEPGLVSARRADDQTHMLLARKPGDDTLDASAEVRALVLFARWLDALAALLEFSECVSSVCFRAVGLQRKEQAYTPVARCSSPHG